VSSFVPPLHSTHLYFGLVHGSPETNKIRLVFVGLLHRQRFGLSGLDSACPASALPSSMALLVASADL
jgi:hypothetical protein